VTEEQGQPPADAPAVTETHTETAPDGATVSDSTKVDPGDESDAPDDTSLTDAPPAD
jgi:hypothetical protein